MLPVSADYKKAAMKTNRSSAARILFGVYDVTAKDDATITATTNQSFVAAQSLTGDIRDPEYKIGTFEPNYFKLDGTFHLMPDDANPTQDIIGWWSRTMSDHTGGFSSTPQITARFSSGHSSLGIGLFFGTDDYCTDFEVVWYNGNTRIGEIMIVGNDKRECNIHKPVENYDRIVIRFMKTRKPYRYARMMEIGFGLEESFSNDELVSAKTVEELDPSGASLSISTLKFTVMNKDQRFNMLNPDGIYSFLQRRQKIVAKSGLMTEQGVIEYVPLGNYYLSDWKNATGLTASLEATDALGILDRTEYRMSPFWSNAPVEEVFRNILNDAGQFQLVVLPSAASIRVKGYIPPKSHRNALLDVCIASGCSLRITRSGIFEVGKGGGTVVGNISNELIVGSPTIEQRQLITSVEVKEYSYVLDGSVSEIYKSTITLVGTQTIIIDFDKPVFGALISVSGAGSMVSHKTSVVCAQVVVAGTGSLTITITGIEYTERSTLRTASIPNIPVGETPQTALVADNKLITDGSGVATRILNYHQRRIKQRFKYLSNPAIEAGDIVSVETMFGISFNGTIERQDITFAPNLSADVEAIG